VIIEAGITAPSYKSGVGFVGGGGGRRESLGRRDVSGGSGGARRQSVTADRALREVEKALGMVEA
jgi:hypothetical protein